MPPTRCCSRARRCRTRSASARSRSSSARRATISACASSSASARRSCRRTSAMPTGSTSWSSARWRWRAAVPEDPYCGLAPAEMLAREWPDLDLADPVEPAPETLIARAAAAEDAARAVTGVTNSEGAEASWSRSRVALVDLERLRRHLCRHRPRRQRRGAGRRGHRRWSATTIIRARSMPPISRTPPRSASAPASAR